MEKFQKLEKEKFVHFAQKAVVKVYPMNRADYNAWRGWELPSDENGEDEGYLVQHLQVSEANTPENGYVNWMSHEQFYRTHVPVESVLDRMVVERAELRERIKSLNNFLQEVEESEDKLGLSQTELDLLMAQYTAMTTYFSIINIRINVYIDKHKGELMGDNQEPEE